MLTGRRALSLMAGIVVGATIGGIALAAPRIGRVPFSNSPPEVIADSLIGLWIDSLGGMEAYERFQSATYTITTVWYDSLSGRVVRSRPRHVWMKKGPRGHQVRVERREAEGFIEQGFDGGQVWATLNGQRLPETAKDWREADYVAGDLFYWPGLPFKLRDAGVILTYQGKRSRPGAEFRADPNARVTIPRRNGYHTIAVTFAENVGDGQDVFHYYFEPGKALPTEVNYREEGSEVTNRVIWGETVARGAIRYPIVTRRDWIANSGKRTKALVMSDVIINPDLPPALFRRPD